MVESIGIPLLESAYKYSHRPPRCSAGFNTPVITVSFEESDCFFLYTPLIIKIESNRHIAYSYLLA
jgi:hypothetical protein